MKESPAIIAPIRNKKTHSFLITSPSHLESLSDRLIKRLNNINIIYKGRDIIIASEMKAVEGEKQ